MAVRFLSSENIDGVLTFSTTGTFGNNASITHYTNNYLYIRGGSAGLVVGDNTSATRAEFSSSNFITWEINSNAAMHINSSRNLGVGTSNPNHRVDIYSNENIPLRIHRPSNSNLNSAGAHGIGFSTRSDAITSTTDTRSGIFSYYNGNLFFATNTSNIESDPDGSARMTILNTGYVGINTTNPLNQFDVRGTAYITGYTVGFDTSPQGNYAYRLTNDGGNSFTNVLGGNLGIGTTSPNGKLHVENGSSGAGSAWTNADELIIENSGNVGLTLQSPNTAAATIAFQDPQSVQAGWIQYLHADNAMRFATNGNFERMRITSDGALLVGDSVSPSTVWEGVGVFGESGNKKVIIGHLEASVLGENIVGGHNSALDAWDNLTIAGNVLKFRTSTSIVERMRIDSSGNVGIGTTSVNSRLQVRIGGIGSNANDEVDGVIFEGDRHDLIFKQIRTAASSDWNSTTFRLQNRVDTTLMSSIDFVTDASYNRHIDINTASNAFNTRFAHNGRVGIGTHSPSQKLDVSGAIAINGTETISSNRQNLYLNSFAGDGGAGIFFRDGFTYNCSITAEDHNGAAADGICISGYDGISFSTGSNSKNEVVRITGGASNIGRVGIGTQSPTAKLEIVGSNGTNIFRGNFGGSADIFMGFDNANPYLTLQDNSNVTTHLFQSNVNNYIVNSNVGIGVTSPSFKTHFRGGSNTEETVLKLDKSSYADTGGHTTILGFGNEPAGWAKGGIGYERTGSYDRGKIHFLQENTGNTDTVTLSDSVMTIQPDGYVGIGTTSPGALLEINGVDDSGATDLLRLEFDNSPADTGITFTNLFGAVKNRITMESNNTDKLMISAAHSIEFSTNTTSSNTNQRLTISNAGNVGIGTTSPSDKLEVTTSASQYTGRFDYTGSSGGAYGCLKLRISANTSPSFIDLFYDGYSTNPLTPVGAIVTTGSSVLYSSFSDYRLKENVADLTGALDKVNSLQPKTFNYINRPEATNEGFLAHELQEIVPQAVSGTKDGVDEDGNPKYQGVDNAHLVPLLVGAIKELKAEIENLKSQIQ